TNPQPYEDLCTELDAYCDLLIPELTIEENGDHVLVISCDGRKEGIRWVEELCAAFPVIKGWKTCKYRQGIGFLPAIVDGIQFEENEILVGYSIVSETGEFDVKIYCKGYQKEDRRYGIAALIYLDHSIGEYNTMTQIRYVDVYPLIEGDYEDELLTLRAFSRLF
ncbi:MAG: hypothetical protein JKY03_02230, partial [Aureispira sp.]|nr:hypothetical protein [Aureispira sp.]